MGANRFADLLGPEVLDAFALRRVAIAFRKAQFDIYALLHVT